MSSFPTAVANGDLSDASQLNQFVHDYDGTAPLKHWWRHDDDGGTIFQPNADPGDTTTTQVGGKLQGDGAGTWRWKLSYAGDLYARSGQIVGAFTVGNGLTVSTGGLTVSSGGLTVTAGTLTVTAGGLIVTAGGLTVSAGPVTLTNASLLVPSSAGAAPTPAASLAYDTTAKALVVGDGTAAHQVADLDSTQTLAGKTLTAPTIADFTNAKHDHGDDDDGGPLASPTITTPTVTDGVFNYSAGLSGTAIVTGALTVGSNAGKLASANHTHSDLYPSTVMLFPHTMTQMSSNVWFNFYYTLSSGAVTFPHVALQAGTYTVRVYLHWDTTSSGTINVVVDGSSVGTITTSTSATALPLVQDLTGVVLTAGDHSVSFQASAGTPKVSGFLIFRTA